jgi:DNA-binding CsgD family transcriptional regulator
VTSTHQPPDLERLWEFVFEGSANAMVILDDERRIRRANRAAATLLELPRESLVGLRVDDLTPDWLLPCLEDGWPDFLREGSIVQRRALTLSDGRTIEVDYCATANVLPGRHLAIYTVGPGGDERERAETVAVGGDPALTPRELEVVGLLARGLSGSKIADRLIISPETVRTHIRNAMEKRGARTRSHLIAIAVRDGLIRP